MNEKSLELTRVRQELSDLHNKESIGKNKSENLKSTVQKLSDMYDAS